MDVVEINPPLIVWLNMIAVALARALGMSAIVVYRLGVLAVLAARWLCPPGCCAVSLPGDAGSRRASAAARVRALPAAGRDYGEREHLVLALVLPYVFLVTARREGRPLPPSWRWHRAGAAMAFALKPHFLLLWLGAEIWLRSDRTRRFDRPHPETVLIIGLLAAYGLSIILLTPEYLGLVRLLAGPYNRFLYEEMIPLLVTGPGALLALFALLAWLALRTEARHGALWTGLASTIAAASSRAPHNRRGCATTSILRSGWRRSCSDSSCWTRRHRQSDAHHLPAARRGRSCATVAVVLMQNVVVALGSGGDSDRTQFDALVDAVRSRGHEMPACS